MRDSPGLRQQFLKIYWESIYEIQTERPTCKKCQVGRCGAGSGGLFLKASPQLILIYSWVWEAAASSETLFQFFKVPLCPFIFTPKPQCQFLLRC